MNGQVLLAALSLFPAFALWAAWPRRRWASWASGIACMALWLGGFSGPGGDLAVSVAEGHAVLDEGDGLVGGEEVGGDGGGAGGELSLLHH